MAEALSSSFDNWTRSLLHELRLNDDDINDFVQYLMSVVTSDSETDEEKRETITELFTELDLKVRLILIKENLSKRKFIIFTE